MRCICLTAVSLALVWGPLAAAPTLGSPIGWDLDPAQTTVQFTLPAALHTVHGTFKLKRGSIRYNAQTGAVSGEVVVDATSGNSGSEGRDHRMHKNVLESARYPEIVFVPDKAEGALTPQGTSQVQLHGGFRIHGATHEMTIPMKVEMENGQATAIMRFLIPYVKWGMKNPSTLFLRVSEQVEIEITTHFHAEWAGAAQAKQLRSASSFVVSGWRDRLPTSTPFTYTQ